MNNYQKREAHTSISNGTLATLTGWPYAGVLRKVEYAWVKWIQDQPDKEWDTWQQCWKEFQEYMGQTEGNWVL